MPSIALLHWGDVIEDFLDPLGVSLEGFRDRMTGGWMFGYVEALRTAGVETVVVCVSRAIRAPVRWRHGPTGATMILLPVPDAYLALRRRLAEPYAWSVRESARRPGALGMLEAAVARELAPYAATPIRALATELRRAGCAAILCQEYEFQRFDVCVALGRVMRLPVVATFQGGTIRTGLERVVRPLTLHACRALIIGSRAEAERVHSRYGVAPARIASIFNPLDLSTWTAAGRAPLRNQLGLERHVVVGWHGRVDVHNKGLDVLLDAWGLLRARETLPSRRLLLVGTGADAPLLADRIARAGFDDVTWVDEYILDKARVAEHLAAIDVYVHPSRHEGFPVAPIEAMACGLPVVAADAPGITEILEGDGRSGGVVVPRGEPAALAAALEELIADDERRAELGRRARQRAESAFSLEAVGAALRRVLLDD